MATYSVKEVEKLTGVKAHTLRIWERRYSFIIPKRTETNIRYYDDEQIKTLINVGLLVRHGHRVSKIDKMGEDKINSLIESIVVASNVDNKDIIDTLNVYMLSYDEKGFNEILERQILRVGLFTTVVDLMYPFLNNVGILWSVSKTTPAQEHFVSNIIRQKVISAIDKISLKINSNKTIVLYIPEGEKHELGLLLSSYLAKDLGWKVIYLGLNVPFENIRGVIEDINPNLIFTILTMPNENFDILQTSFMSKNVDALLYSGYRDNKLKKIETDNFFYINSPIEFINYLKTF